MGPDTIDGFMDGFRISFIMVATVSTVNTSIMAIEWTKNRHGNLIVWELNLKLDSFRLVAAT